MGRRAIRRAFSMERRLEKIRSWNRCSVGSSNKRERSRSLESGVILLRLNHELLPEPGNPIANTTTPFGERAAVAAGAVASGALAEAAGTAAASAATGEALIPRGAAGVPR